MTPILNKLPRYHTGPVLFAVTCLLGAILIVAFIITPAQREMKDINGRIYTQRQALEFLYAQGQSFRIAAREFDAIKSDIPLLESAFFRLGEELSAITVFESIASEAGVDQTITLDTAQNAPVDKRAPPTPYRRVILRLDLAGTFAQLLEVLDKIESLPQQLNVLSIGMDSDFRGLPPIQRNSGAQAMSPVPAATGKKLRITVTAATYWMEPAAPKEAE